MKANVFFGIVFLIVSCLGSCVSREAHAVQNVTFKDTASIVKGSSFIIELVEKPWVKVDLSKLRAICEENGLQHPNIHQWKDHFVVFDTASYAAGLESKISTAFQGAVVKTYRNPFYEFNRSHCGNDPVAKVWDHVILTANLVEDTVLQKEYMDYHATQFQKWPEVSKGFCNANFQQLLVFRNGRQLMLVISIPKGSSLDELNPKTTENNPRVDDWNALMKKYQEGIEGTKPGEVWVFLEEVGK
ncbi:L-rhamnose mutarotase [Chitinophagaceae bacterium LB-8]|uniref:L-rhamnose mutarotase n=1 Tax=Paraflavisolibacter caeni TaxID=2982496 RepID=A0A9X2XPQ1_9BACT|nr:L-rhamnose mutarotase [Paraflavisolibacter caeni]MCU7551908.1 L-rhamnose mutarotase [Paraflavisolibacter caeni]